ncbi:MAG: hypothetical protein ABI904_23615 [Chloroflexota bacterium]
MLTIIIGSSGCASANPAPINYSISPTISNPTELPIPTASWTPYSTITPSALPSATLTAMPTLAEFDAKAEILQLLANNSCEFPCLWGISPGITHLDEVKNLNRFSIFSDGGGVFSEKGGRLFLRIPQTNNLLLNLSLEVDMVDGIVDETFFGTQMVRKIGNGYEDVLGEQSYADITKGFSLSRVLSQYGEPSEVYIFTRKVVPLGDPWDFNIVLFYPKNRFMAYYESSVERVKNGNILGCPSLASSYFWFWNPSKEVSMSDVIARYDLQQAKPIDVATDMNVKTFYTLFKEPGNEKCIETPQDMWPLP